MDATLFSEKLVGKGEYNRPVTKGGYYLDEVRSSIQKMIRRGKEEECFFWSYELYDSGMWRYLVRTLVTVAGEDIGMVNPQAMNLCMTSYLYFEHLAKQRGENKKIKCKNCGHVEETKGYYQPHWDELGLLISLLCNSPKNRHVDFYAALMGEKRQRGLKLEVEQVSQDGHTRRGKERQKEEGVSKKREFYSNGAKVVGYKSFNKDKERKVKDELMKTLGLTDLIGESDELDNRKNGK